LRIIDLSEPDFCTYQIKLATKYLCRAGSQMPKISSKFDPTKSELKENRVSIILDEE
jgi:hypothetical protein